MAHFTPPSVDDVTEISASVSRRDGGGMIKPFVTLRLTLSSGPDDSVQLPIYMPADCAAYADRIAAGINAAFTDPIEAAQVLEAAE